MRGPAQTDAPPSAGNWIVDAVAAAHYRVAPFLAPTPLVRLAWLDAPGRRVWGKLECNQRCGSFKARGAFAALTRLDRDVAVVTASAGNHGLAIAQAAEALGRRATVFVPYGASEAKVRRIGNSGAEVVAAGRDLSESIRFARAAATSSAAHFVSPFDHPDVVVGQGTIVPELAAQRPEGFDHVLVPFGGGGLFVGLALAARRRWPGLRAHAVVPAVFRRPLADGFAESLRQPTLPTIADGLAVQHEPESWLAPIIDEQVAQPFAATEREIGAAMLALLHQESLLVEGAGAIALAPLLSPDAAGRFAGDTLVILSGGNVSVSQLARVMTDDFATTEFDRVRLGLAHKPLVPEAARRSFHTQPVQAAPLHCVAEQCADGDQEASWRRRLAELAERVVAVRGNLAAFAAFVSAEGLDADPAAIEMVETEVRLCERAIARAGGLEERALVRGYRMALQHHMLASRALDWCCQSSEHVREVMFFDPSDVQPAAVNYDRYGGAVLRRAEAEMLAQLGFDPLRQVLLLTSSGQAAFTVLEGYLIRGGMRRAKAIVTSPYIYFEAMEQLAALGAIRVDAVASWSLGGMIEAVERADASALFVDPVANTAAMDVVDLRALARLLAGRDWSDRYLVIDGTMLSGGFDPFAMFAFPGAPHVLLYESLSKYGQLGLDLQMAGAVIAPAGLEAELRRIRRNSGATMYAAQAHLLPGCPREDFLLRMRRLTANAERISAVLRTPARCGTGLRVRFPNGWRSLGWRHGGGLVAVTFDDPGLNNHGILEAVIERILDRCRRDGLPITKGVSFGFGTTRISAAAAMAGTTDPFLRISAGEEPAEGIERLAHAIADGIADAVTRLAAWKENAT